MMYSWSTRPLNSRRLARRRRERREARRRVTSQLSLLVRHPNLDPSPALSASTARLMVTGKHNCPKYLEDKKAGKIVRRDKGIFDIHVIDLFLTSAGNKSWIFDTGSVAHISNSSQGLRNRRSLMKDEVTMHMGNGCQIEVV